MRFPKFIALIAGLAAGSAAFAGPTGLTDDRNARDMTFATEWFAGEFNNDLQIWFETDPRSATPVSARHERIHSVHKRLPDSVLGTPAFLVSEYRSGDRAQLIRTHVVSFQSLKPKDGIRLRYHALRDGTRPASDLTADRLKAVPGCDVVLHRRAAQLEGRSMAGACFSGTGKGRLAVDESIWLGPDVYSRSRRETARHAGNAAGAASEEIPIAFYKARGFDCSATMFAHSYLKPSATDRTYSFQGRHDLGDTMTVESPRDGKSYHIQLRRQRYPYYREGGEFLLLRLREVGAETSAALVTSDTGNENISLNLGWAAINCSAHRP